jgi:hypothetical protein
VTVALEQEGPETAEGRQHVQGPGCNYLIPGVRCGGCSARSLCTCSLEGWISAKRSVRAALKGTAPPMALRVLGRKPRIRPLWQLFSKVTPCPAPGPHNAHPKEGAGPDNAMCYGSWA